MSLATAHMITFTNDATLMHNHSPYHWIGLRILPTIPCQLKATAHVHLISCQHTIHNLSIPFINIINILLTTAKLLILTQKQKKPNHFHSQTFVMSPKSTNFATCQIVIDSIINIYKQHLSTTPSTPKNGK
jgi:hypothetical protein